MPVPTRGGCTPKEEWPWPRHSPSPGTRHTDKQWKYTYHHYPPRKGVGEWVGEDQQQTAMLSKAHKLTATLSSNKQTGTATLSSATITLTSSGKYTYDHTYQDQEWVGGRRSATDSNAVNHMLLTATLSNKPLTATLSSKPLTATLSSNWPHSYAAQCTAWR